MKVIIRRENGVLKRSIEVTMDDIVLLQLAVDSGRMECMSKMQEAEKLGNSDDLSFWQNELESYNKALDDLTADNWHYED